MENQTNSPQQNPPKQKYKIIFENHFQIRSLISPLFSGSVLCFCLSFYLMITALTKNETSSGFKFLSGIIIGFVATTLLAEFYGDTFNKPVIVENT